MLGVFRIRQMHRDWRFDARSGSHDGKPSWFLDNHKTAVPMEHRSTEEQGGVDPGELPRVLQIPRIGFLSVLTECTEGNADQWQTIIEFRGECTGAYLPRYNGTYNFSRRPNEDHGQVLSMEFFLWEFEGGNHWGMYLSKSRSLPPLSAWRKDDYSNLLSSAPLIRSYCRTTFRVSISPASPSI